MSQEVQMAATAVTEAAHATEATGGLGMLGINLKIFLAQLLNFTVVLLVLWKWAYTPIVKLLDERSRKVSESLDQAKNVEERVVILEKEQKEVIKQAKLEAEAIIEEARGGAEQQKIAMLATAKQEVTQVVQQGKRQLQAEKNLMLQEARKDIIDLAIQASEKILSASVNEKKAQAIAEEVIESLT